MTACQSIEDGGEIGLRIEAIQFGRFNDGIDGSGALTATIGTGKEPVLAYASDSGRAQGQD